jgi:hypothetical protein
MIDSGQALTATLARVRACRLFAFSAGLGGVVARPGWRTHESEDADR